MKHHFFYMVLLLAFFGGTCPCMAQEETLHFGRFGEITLYRQSDHPSHVVIFVSGDGGWNLGNIFAKNGVVFVKIELPLSQQEKTTNAIKKIAENIDGVREVGVYVTPQIGKLIFIV